MKGILSLLLIIALVLVAGIYGVYHDVSTSTDEIRQEGFDEGYKKGYKDGSKETYKYLNKLGVAEEHRLNRTKADDFSDFMFQNREKEE